MDKISLTVAEVAANIDMETFRAVVTDPEVEEHVTKAETLYRSAANLRARIRVLENEAESAEAQMDRAYDEAKKAALQCMPCATKRASRTTTRPTSSTALTDALNDLHA